MSKLYVDEDDGTRILSRKEYLRATIEKLESIKEEHSKGSICTTAANEDESPSTSDLTKYQQNNKFNEKVAVTVGLPSSQHSVNEYRLPTRATYIDVSIWIFVAENLRRHILWPSSVPVVAGFFQEDEGCMIF